MPKLFRHIFLKKKRNTEERENLNDIYMAKVRDLRDFYKTVTRKNNGKSDVKFHRFYPLHLVVLIKQKYLSLVAR